MDKNVKKFNILLKKISEGNKTALETIYNDYGGLFFAMAKKYLYNKSLAEDLISEVFIRIVKYSHCFDDSQNGLNWVIKIIQNSAFKMNSIEKKHECDNIDDHFELYSVIDDPSIAMQDESLSFALKQLNEVENKIIYLKFWEGLSTREIAKQMNLPKSTVHYKIQLVFKKLEKTIKKLDKYENKR